MPQRDQRISEAEMQQQVQQAHQVYAFEAFTQELKQDLTTAIVAALKANTIAPEAARLLAQQFLELLPFQSEEDMAKKIDMLQKLYESQPAIHSIVLPICIKVVRYAKAHLENKVQELTASKPAPQPTPTPQLTQQPTSLGAAFAKLNKSATSQPQDTPAQQPQQKLPEPDGAFDVVQAQVIAYYQKALTGNLSQEDREAVEGQIELVKSFAYIAPSMQGILITKELEARSTVLTTASPTLEKIQVYLAALSAVDTSKEIAELQELILDVAQQSTEMAEKALMRVERLLTSNSATIPPLKQAPVQPVISKSQPAPQPQKQLEQKKKWWQR